VTYHKQSVNDHSCLFTPHSFRVLGRKKTKEGIQIKVSLSQAFFSNLFVESNSSYSSVIEEYHSLTSASSFYTRENSGGKK
jgi:hypothetical protein